MRIGSWLLAGALIFTGLFPSPVAGQDLLISDFTGSEPSMNTPWTATSYLDGTISYSGWDLGAGAHPVGGIDNAFAFYVTAGSPESTLEEAIADEEYLHVTIQPVTGVLNLSGKKIVFTIQRVDWHAPMRYALLTSIDGFSTAHVLFSSHSTGKSDFENNEYLFFMPLSGYNGITDPVEFRLYAFDAEWSGHTTTLTGFSILQPGPLYTLDLTAGSGGSVGSIPEGTLFEEGTLIQLTAVPSSGYRFGGWSGDVDGFGNPRTMVMDGNKSIQGLFEPLASGCMNVGTNLAGVTDWSTAWVFVDTFKMSREWLTRSVGGSEWDSGKRSEILVDADGWPLELPFYAPSDGEYHYVHTLMPAPESGEYTVVVDGSGELEFWGAASSPVWTPAGGTTSYSLTVPAGSEGTLFVDIYASAPADPVRNIRVIRPGFETVYETEPFHPLFLERLEPFENLRFMDWAATNGSPLVSWSNRTTATSYTQTRPQGVALEYMVLLANTLGRDPWICIPHMADDDTVRGTARLLRDTVDPGRLIYVEYSNETWNTAGGFPQTTYVQDMGELLGLSPDRWTAGQRYCALRSVQIWDIFDQEFSIDSRIQRVMATQSANISVTNLRTDALNDPSINPLYIMPHALAGAPYFGRNYSPDDIPPTAPEYPTVDEILDSVAPQSILSGETAMTAQKIVADQQGWRLVCYEGGQHFVGIFGAENDDTLTAILHAVNRDPRMYDRYTEYLDMLRTVGVDMFSNFSYVSAWSKWGSWGVLEYQDQAVLDAPKYRALTDWIDGNPCLSLPVLSRPGMLVLLSALTLLIHRRR